MKQQKKAVIDIDNTLWHFCDVLFERLQKINEAIDKHTKNIMITSYPIFS